MSAIGKRTIYVGGGVNSALPLNVEGVAVAGTAPGTLMDNGAAGLAISAAAATDKGAQLLFADKDQLRSKSVDDAWTINENMVAIQGRSGDILNVLVETAITLVDGDPMCSNGAGLLTKATVLTTTAVSSEVILAYADESLTTSGTTLVRVKIA